MRKILQVLLFSILLFSCKKDENSISISNFREELIPALSSLSTERSLPVADTISKSFIQENATKGDLILLMESQKPLLRVVAFDAIVNRSDFKDKPQFQHRSYSC